MTPEVAPHFRFPGVIFHFREKKRKEKKSESLTRLTMREGFEMAREEALKRVEKKADNKINFVPAHSAFPPNINKILRRLRHYLRGR